MGFAHRTYDLVVAPVRWQYHRARLRAAGGVVMTDAGVRLHLDLDDRRAARLRATRGALDADAIAIWQRLVPEVQPTLVIDVGANYGEVVFSARYPHARQIHLIEPNPAVQSCLEQTVEGLDPGWPTVVRHSWAATSGEGTAALQLGKDSGAGSLVHEGAASALVPTARIDQAIEVLATDRLLFKVDVEGGEKEALEGMRNVAPAACVGVCEIEHADPDTVSFLFREYSVSVIDPRGTEVAITEEDCRRLLRLQQEDRNRSFRNAVLRR